MTKILVSVFSYVGIASFQPHEKADTRIRVTLGKPRDQQLITMHCEMSPVQTAATTAIGRLL
jgi:hypothetical protein